MLAQNEVVGHARDVIADHALALGLLQLLLIAERQFFRMRHPETEQISDDIFETIAIGAENRTGVELCVQELLGCTTGCIHLRAEPEQAFGIFPGLPRAMDSGGANAMPAGMNQIGHHAVEQAAQRLTELDLCRGTPMALFHFPP